MQGHVDSRTPLTAQLGMLYPLIGTRQTSLRQELIPVRDNDAGSDDDDSMEQPQPQSTNMSVRTEVLCDILSSFDPTLLPEEFMYHYLVRPVPMRRPHPGGTHVPGSLPATIYHIAHRDDAFRERLQQAVPKDARANQYFEKQYTRARASLQQMTRHISTSSREQQHTDDDDIPDVALCAKTLRSIVHQMCSSRDARTAGAPLGIDIVRRLAEILVRLVAQVVTLDKDLDPLRSVKQEDEHPRMTNLFLYLIGDPPKDPALPPWMNDAFVIDRLRGYPSSEWSHLLELLTTIKDGIEEKDMEALPGAVEYAAKIDDMLRDYTATANEPSSSSAQMPRRT